MSQSVPSSLTHEPWLYSALSASAFSMTSGRAHATRRASGSYLTTYNLSFPFAE